MARVELKHVTKKFNDVVAVNDVSFVVEDHEFAVILGPSGCGKTTTLRLIAGLEQVTSGEIYIGDRLVNNVPPKDRNIAMVFQNYALYPHMTVYDNMAFGLRMRKVPKDEIDRRVKEAAKILKIDHLLGRKPKELSGGQRQRVALGRAIVRNPDVFLFDEPLSNLDAKMRVHMRAELAKLHKKLNATSVYVTHDQVEAMTLGDKIILMNSGVIQQIDDPLSLYHSPRNKFVAGFIGSPPMNFFEGELKEDGDKIYFENPDFKLEVPEKLVSRLKRNFEREVFLGIRPEDIRSERDKKPEMVPVMNAVVDFVETLGNEILIYYRTEHGVSFVSRVPPFNPPQSGESLKVYFYLDRLHFFSKKTELNLTL